MACTRAYADVLAAARKAGSGIEAADAVIAAIALDNGFSVATRDVSPLLAAGVKDINPWEDQEESGHRAGLHDIRRPQQKRKPDVNRTGNCGGCLVKVKQVPQSVLQALDSNALRLRLADVAGRSQ